MWSNRTRLLALGGLAAALAGVYLVVNGLPWSRPSAPGNAPEGLATSSDSGDPAEGPGPAKAHDPARRASAVPQDYRQLLALGRRQDPANLPVLKKALEEGRDWRVRHAAATGIGRLDKGGDPGLLTSVLANKSEHPEVRAVAAEQLGAMRWYRAGPALIEAMDDDSLVLRAAAGVAIQRIMGVHYGYRADGSANERRQALELIREYWPTFYAYAQSRDRR